MASVNTPGAIEMDWVEKIPQLDDLQAGSLQHLLNRAAQPTGDWSGMMGPSGAASEDFGGLRFQLAFMSYALAVTHATRLPAAPALFREPLDALIQKMLHPDVWIYWRDTSRGGAPLNLSRGEMPSEWDPVGRDNIMYSAYVQSMSLLYHYLFNDPKYAEPGALTFAYRSIMWGDGEAEGGFGVDKSFAYDERSLNEHLYWLMVGNGYLGIACEPNCIFTICQQPSILGFRMHDLVYGGDTAGEVTQGWLKAWEEFGGLVNADGVPASLVLEKERMRVDIAAPGMDFWLTSLLHSWHADFVEELYPALMEKWSVPGPDDTLWVKPVNPLTSMGVAAEEGADDSFPQTAADIGWAAVTASEVGDTETLGRLLAYADRFLHPTWEHGGYFYKRHDEPYDADGHFRAMDPMSSNAILPLARLNVADGLRRLYDGPWDEGHFSEPAVVATSADIDLRRAWFDSERNALALTLGGQATSEPVRLEIANVAGRGEPTLWRDGADFSDALRQEGERLVIAFDHEARTDLVLSW